MNGRRETSARVLSATLNLPLDRGKGEAISPNCKATDSEAGHYATLLPLRC